MIFLNNLFGGGGSGGQGGEVIDYVNGSITVTLPKTSFVHGDTFNTSGAVVTYTSPAGETSNVTSAASFDPSNGSTLTIDGENTVRVSYTPEGKDTVYATQIITVEAVPTELYVKLHDSGMRAGEAVSYKGAIVTALMSDRTERDVSNENLVWSPLPGTVESNEGSINVTCSYTSNGVTVNGSAELNVTDKTLTGISMTLGKTSYLYGENFDDTNTVVTATYSDGSTANVKSECEFLPEVRSKLETTGNVSVLCSYTENAVTKRATGTITVNKIPLELTVKFTDNGFREGDYLAYTNATVTARWSDNSTSDVTNLCTWSPAAGTILDRNGTQTVTATYHTDNWDISGSSIVNVTSLNLQSIGATFTRTSYRDGDSLDLSGSKVTALYDNASTKDVTANASWTPSDRTTLKKGDNKVTCTYRENNKVVSVDVPITVAYVTGIEISGLDTSYEANDTITYDNAVVTATYSDGSTADVTDSVTWSPSDGHKLETTDKTVRATYRDNSGITHTANYTIDVGDIPTKLTVEMAINSYEKGDTLNTAGSSVVVEYASGSEKTLKVSDVTWNPANGKTLNNVGTQFITVTYKKGSVTLTDRTSVSVTAKTNQDSSDQKKRDGSNIAAALGGNPNSLTDVEKEEIGAALGETVTGEDGATYAKVSGVADAFSKMYQNGDFPDKTTYKYGNVSAVALTSLNMLKWSFYTPGHPNQPTMYGPIAEERETGNIIYVIADPTNNIRVGAVHNINNGHYTWIYGEEQPSSSYLIISPNYTVNQYGEVNAIGTTTGVSDVSYIPKGIPVTDVGQTLLSLSAYGEAEEVHSNGSKIDPTGKSKKQIEEEITEKAAQENLTYNFSQDPGDTMVKVTDENGNICYFLGM